MLLTDLDDGATHGLLAAARRNLKRNTHRARLGQPAPGAAAEVVADVAALDYNWCADPSWQPPPLAAGGEVVLGVDVVYRRTSARKLRACLLRLLAPGGTALLAVPGSRDGEQKTWRPGFHECVVRPCLSAVLPLSFHLRRCLSVSSVCPRLLDTLPASGAVTELELEMEQGPGGEDGLGGLGARVRFPAGATRCVVRD
eukprot:SAG22_NODE_792_length_7198_cov_1.752641_4_plen_199_part_00